MHDDEATEFHLILFKAGFRDLIDGNIGSGARAMAGFISFHGQC